MTQSENKTALVVIDVQQGLDNPHFGRRNNPHAEKNIALLLSRWRSAEWPVVHVHHHSSSVASPLHPTHAGVAVKPEAQPLPTEPCFIKSVNSAFIGTGLEAWLTERSMNNLVVVGLTAEHCVSTSVRMAANLGFQVTLVADATASHDKQDINGESISAEAVFRVNVASLADEFCTVCVTQDLLD